MSAGRNRVVGLAWFALLAAAPLAADDKVEKTSQPAEVACPDEQPAVADDSEEVQFCIEPLDRKVYALTGKSADPEVVYGRETRVVSRPIEPNPSVNSHRRKSVNNRDEGKGRTSGIPSHDGWIPNGDVFYGRENGHPLTLTEAMRRVAGWGESCPLCGKPHAVEGDATAILPATPVPEVGQQELDYSGVGKQASNAPSPNSLRAGEPAQIILDTQKRLGNSVLEGTEFSGSPELLIQWIRALDEENRRRQPQQHLQFESIPVTVAEDLPVTPQSQVAALRDACRQLQEAADLLEDQNLFESADSLRAAADSLRHQAREKVADADQPSNDGE